MPISTAEWGSEQEHELLDLYVGMNPPPIHGVPPEIA